MRGGQLDNLPIVQLSARAAETRMESKEQGLTLHLRVKPRRMRVRQALGDFLRECCQTRMTFRPLPRSWRVTWRSRAMLASCLRSEKARLEFGLVSHLGLMCQLSLPAGARMSEPARFKL